VAEEGGTLPYLCQCCHLASGAALAHAGCTTWPRLSCQHRSGHRPACSHCCTEHSQTRGSGRDSGWSCLQPQQKHFLMCSIEKSSTQAPAVIPSCYTSTYSVCTGCSNMQHTRQQPGSPAPSAHSLLHNLLRPTSLRAEGNHAVDGMTAQHTPTTYSIHSSNCLYISYSIHSSTDGWHNRHSWWFLATESWKPGAAPVLPLFTCCAALIHQLCQRYQSCCTACRCTATCNSSPADNAY